MSGSSRAAAQVAAQSMRLKPGSFEGPQAAGQGRAGRAEAVAHMVEEAEAFEDCGDSPKTFSSATLTVSRRP